MSSPHRLGHDLLLYTLKGGAAIPDPGDAEQIHVDKSYGVCELTIGTGVETRTLPDPTVGTNGMGIGTVVHVIANQIGSGGTCTVEGVGFDTEGQTASFMVGTVNGAKAWKVLSSQMFVQSGFTIPSGQSITFDAAAGPAATLLLDVNGNELLETAAATLAVNQFLITNANTGVPPALHARGDDTSVSIRLVPKAAGVVLHDAAAGLGGTGFLSASTVVTTAGAVTYTIGQVKSGFIERDPAGAGRADLLPTAENIVAALTDSDTGAGYCMLFIIKNTADMAEAITVTTNTGLTLTGDMVISQNELKFFLLRVTEAEVGSEAVTVFGLGSIAHNT